MKDSQQAPLNCCRYEKMENSNCLLDLLDRERKKERERGGEREREKEREREREREGGGGS